MRRKINGAITVDKKVPLPPPRTGEQNHVYPWRTMEVGDSFAVPTDKMIANFRHGASLAGRINQRRFSVRQTPDGYRCWRIA